MAKNAALLELMNRKQLWDADLHHLKQIALDQIRDVKRLRNKQNILEVFDVYGPTNLSQFHPPDDGSASFEWYCDKDGVEIECIVAIRGCPATIVTGPTELGDIVLRVFVRNGPPGHEFRFIASVPAGLDLEFQFEDEEDW